MTSLRQRKLEDMQIRHLAQTTQEIYLQRIAAFAKHFHKCPSQLGPEQIRDYQLYLLKKKQASPSVLIQVAAALRFLCGTTLSRAWAVVDSHVIPVRHSRSIPMGLETTGLEFPHWSGGETKRRRRAAACSPSGEEFTPTSWRKAHGTSGTSRS